MHVWLGKMTVAPSRAVLSILPKLNLTKNAKQPNKQLEFWNQSHAQQREEWHYLIKDTCVIIKCLSQCLHDTEDSSLKNIWTSVSWQLSPNVTFMGTNFVEASQLLKSPAKKNACKETKGKERILRQYKWNKDSRVAVSLYNQGI